MNKLLQKHLPTYYRTQQNLSVNDRGTIFITALIVGLLLTFVGISLADTSTRQLRTTNEKLYRTNAFLTAEAGIERSLYELNIDNDFSGYEDEVEFFNYDNKSRGTYTTEVSSGTGNEKILTSTGRVFRSNGNLESERKIKVSLVGTASSIPSVYAGVGGLSLGGSARINNSDVHVNGRITMSGAASIGSDTNPVNLTVANYACPNTTNPGPSYPSLCTTQPITIPNWGSTLIIGSTCATGQTQAKFPESQWNTSLPQIRAGSTGGDGLIPGCVASPTEMPTYDRSAHINKMTTVGTMSNINYNCSQWQSGTNFTRTWPANLQLTGNVDLTSSCDLTITGDVYITGNLTIGGAATIRIAESLGNTVPTIVVDGTINAGGGGKILANSSGTALRLISFRSYNNCHPSCTGNDLKLSQDMQNVTVDGGGQYPGSAFQAYWSTIKISGSGLIGSAMGQKVDMSGAGNITFGTNLSSGTTTWTIRSYQYDY
ncbi:hypothetical protein KC867_00690 [Candidatus Saccharibacteria bacterium]|nr:hypothetical protein [Candidatus Saccharibacteria bacterium]